MSDEFPLCELCKRTIWRHELAGAKAVCQSGETSPSFGPLHTAELRTWLGLSVSKKHRADAYAQGWSPHTGRKNLEDHDDDHDHDVT